MVKMPLAWRKERGAYYEDQIKRASTYKHQMVQRREKLRELYNKEPGGFDSNYPFEGAADIHLPLILDKVETAVPKVVSAAWRAEPFVNVLRPNKQVGLDMAKNTEKFTTWAFRNDVPNFYMSFENFNRNRFIDGTAFAKIRWVRKWRRTIEVHNMSSLAMDEGQEVPREKSIEEIFADIFKLGDPRNTYYDVKPLVNGDETKYEVKFTEAGLPYTAYCMIMDAERVGEIDVKVIRDVLEMDNPVFENVDMEDLVFPARAKCLQTADWVAHKTWYTIDELKRKMKKGWQITKKDLEFAEGVKKSVDVDAIGEQAKDRLIGESPNLGEEQHTKDKKVDPNRVLVWEVYARDYVEGNDQPMDVILHILDRNRKVIGIKYHDEVFPHGRRPFVHDTYIPIDGRVYGIGMAEVLYGINLSLNKTVNDVHNSMSLKATPFFLYSMLGLAENSTLLDGIRPGTGIPVGDVNQVRFPEFMQDPAGQFHTSFETMMGFADGLTFSRSVGGSNNYRNAPRTARGTLALMDAAEEKLSSLVEQSQATSWKEMVRQVVALYGRYLSVDKWYHVTGDPNPVRVSPAELRQNWHYEFSGSLTSVNRDVQRTLAERLYMVLRQDPLYQGDPRAHQQLVKKYIEAFSDIGDVDLIVPDLEGEGGLAHPPWEQKTEMYALIAGKHVQVLPVDDDAKHLDEIKRFKESRTWETISVRGQAMIDVHEEDHEQALKQKMAQAQRNPGGGGGIPDVSSAGNPSQGTPGLGGELSAMEGGIA